VIYPHVTRFDEAVDALEDSGFAWEAVALDPEDNEAYYRLLADLWRSGDDFLICEQDMVPPPGAIKALDECDCEWGGNAYWLYGGFGVWMGVTRFRGELTRRHPDLMETIVSRDWHALDSAIINHLRLLGYKDAHWHWPAAKHLVPKIYVGPQTGQFIQCRCGAPFGNEVFERNPLTCQACGAETWTPLPERTATDITL
jgi:hypothetical protein